MYHLDRTACIWLTDAKGRILNDLLVSRDQPPVGSVTMTNGSSGTAFQRQGDGLWYRAGGKYMPRGITWERLLTYRSVRLVYVAPTR